MMKVPTKEEIICDYRLLYLSRQLSLVGRKEVINGRAKFGIFGDGKELPQIALAKSFRPGDWRSGYYRDQTLMLALGLLSPEQFFAQLYADADVNREPHSAGRQMNCHFSTPNVDDSGAWLDQTSQANTAADLSPTGGQMAKLLGLGYASKLFRQGNIPGSSKFSNHGNEVAFGTIGNASTSEGVFWETLNASCVLGVPTVIFVWDDGYGISVPNHLQTVKSSISEALKGFVGDSFDLLKVKGNDYLGLQSVISAAVSKAREKHIPVLIHVTDLTQPQGHSTSGSHERYKSQERLHKEKEQDCLVVFREWILCEKQASEEELLALEGRVTQEVEGCRVKALEAFQSSMTEERDEVISQLGDFSQTDELKSLARKTSVFFRDNSKAVFSLLAKNPGHDHLQALSRQLAQKNHERFHTFLHLESQSTPVPVKFSNPEMVDGRLIIREFFDELLGSDPRVFILGEDVGQLGGVNLEFEGLSEKHGALRVTDTGIREATILGQGIGCALRGLRPIVDIQYLDYLIYALQGMSDDLASLSYRTHGRQQAPVIVRTKGHRLEGVWHTGSPIGMILGALRGMVVGVPRNSLQAVGMYRALLQGMVPGLVIEVLNGYRVKEPMPENLSEYCLELGQVEVLREGRDITVVSYGAMLRVIEEAARILVGFDVQLEVIDVQTLLPFDRSHRISASIRKTRGVLFADEDVPGGASAYMMERVLSDQKSFHDLDSRPRTLSATAHRCPYGSDGDYFSKPNVEDVVEVCLAMMQERYPRVP